MNSKNYTSPFPYHLLLLNLIKYTVPLVNQSSPIAIQTAIGPMPTTRIRNMQSATLIVHMMIIELIIENFMSPAALSP